MGDHPGALPGMWWAHGRRAGGALQSERGANLALGAEPASCLGLLCVPCTGVGRCKAL